MMYPVTHFYHGFSIIAFSLQESILRIVRFVGLGSGKPPNQEHRHIHIRMWEATR